MSFSPLCNYPKALTIAGSDSGGGAGIQADIKTFQELGAYGMSVITAITAQNTLGVKQVFPASLEALHSQLHAIGEDLTPQAFKTGMLVNASMIKAVAEAVRHFGWKQLVIDPVMLAKGGTALLRSDALDALVEHLLPLSLIITPNIPEAEVLAGMTISTLSEREQAAKRLRQLGASIVVIKGGHDESNAHTAVDLYYEGGQFIYLEGKKINSKHTHGTGCTFSAAITASLACGNAPLEAVHTAKAFIQAAIEAGLPLGAGQGPTNHFAYKKSLAQSADDAVQK